MLRLLSLALVALPSAVLADCPAPYVRADYVAGWLKDQGYALTDWGLMGGSLHELYVGERGFAVVATVPAGCSLVISLPDAPKGRLPQEGTAG